MRWVYWAKEEVSLASETGLDWNQLPSGLQIVKPWEETPHQHHHQHQHRYEQSATCVNCAAWGEFWFLMMEPRRKRSGYWIFIFHLHHLCLLKNLQHSSISTAPQITNVVMFITEVSWPLVRNSTSFSNYWLFEPLPSSCTTIIIINFYNYFTWVLIIWPVTTHDQKAKFISVIIKIITITAPIVL